MSETLVIFGGWSRSAKSYHKLITSAPDGWQVICIPSKEFNKDKLLFLDKLDKFSLMGHSLGGALALEFCAENPSKVKKLILVDSEGIYGNEKPTTIAKDFMFTHIQYGGKKAIENFRAFLRIIGSPLLHLKLARQAQRASFEDQAKEIEIPTTILWGEKDLITPLWQGERLKGLIPNSKLVVLKNMDHDWILHQPQFFWEKVT